MIFGPLSSRRGLRDTTGRGPAAAAELWTQRAAQNGQRDADGAAGGGEAG